MKKEYDDALYQFLRDPLARSCCVQYVGDDGVWSIGWLTRKEFFPQHVFVTIYAPLPRRPLALLEASVAELSAAGARLPYTLSTNHHTSRPFLELRCALLYTDGGEDDLRLWLDAHLAMHTRFATLVSEQSF